MSYFGLLFIILNISSSFSKQLIFVHTHFRHGARAPLKLHDKKFDILNIEWDNPGELTPVGERMHYILGYRNRLRYIEDTYPNFLSQKYDPHEIRIWATTLNRTLMSVYSQLQGMYPISMDEKNKDMLTERQIELSVIPIDTEGNEKIENEMKKLGNYSLPNGIKLPPVYTINPSDLKVRMYDHPLCINKTKELKLNNIAISEKIINDTKKFNEIYGSKINKILNNSENYQLNFTEVESICDAYISEYTEDRDMPEFEKLSIDKEEFLEECFIIQGDSFRDQYFSDEENVFARVESSQLLQEISNYMKLRVDNDIGKLNNTIENDENELNNELYDPTDYSKPKMVMYSAHDTTLSTYEMFLLLALGFNKSLYIVPKYAAQITLEVTREDIEDLENNNLEYKNYNVEYYFNDKLVFSVPFDQYLEKIDAYAWDKTKIGKWCGYIVDDNDDKGNNFRFIILLIVFIAYLFISLSLIVLLIIINKNKAKKLSVDSDFIKDDKGENLPLTQF